MLGLALSEIAARPEVRRPSPRKSSAKSAQESENELAASRRFYGIAGVTVQVEADLPFARTTFGPKFDAFEVNEPGADMIAVRHHFGLPTVDEHELGKWFKEGEELSIGEWQEVAMARAFPRDAGILIRDKGRVAESGIRAEMMDLDGIYRRMYWVQAHAYQTPSAEDLSQP